MSMRRQTFPVLLLLVLFPASLLAGEKTPVEVTLGKNGKALLPVVVAKTATPRIKQAAATLADVLGRIGKCTFEVQQGDGSRGIALGLAPDFPKNKLAPPWDPKDPTHREDYLLRTHPQGLLALGATEQAVEHAVWDILYRLGHRQFFPGKVWEVVPHPNEMRLAVDRHENPSFHSRRIWYGYGVAPYAKEPYEAWCARNRAVSGIQLSTGHAYDGIWSRNKAVFAEHPEYLGLVGGVRKTHQFCISNPGLRELVVRDALRQVASKPGIESLSLEPADGGGWCECDACRKMGTVSDRALTLANTVAAALEKDHPDLFIGMYAYSSHSPPPNIKVQPRVVVSVATAYVQGGFSTDQLMEGWRRQGATLGVREYYSVNVWDRDLPGSPRASRISYLAKTIPHVHKLGARFYSAESSDNWAPCGLGYYLAARMLWDVNQARRIDDLRADFLAAAFGKARETMSRFYEMIDGDQRPLLSDDLIGRLYRLLKEARTATDDPAVLARLDHLVLYAHYLEHWLDYSTAAGDERQRNFQKLLAYAHRIGPTMMIHSRGLIRDLPRRDKSVTWTAAQAKALAKMPQDVAAAEIPVLLEQGIARRRPFAFRPISFSDRLVPAGALKLPAVKPGSFGNLSRGERVVLTWLKEGATLTLRGKAGVIYANRGPARIELFPAAETEGKAVAGGDLPPDRQEHALQLKTAFSGLHRLVVNDRQAGTSLILPEGIAATLRSSPEEPAKLTGRWSLYFYVPKGTKIVGGFSDGVGSLLDGTGKVVHEFGKAPGYFSVPVPPGQDGTLWLFRNSIGRRMLMTVPPYLARSPEELLLPEEVVRADARK